MLPPASKNVATGGPDGSKGKRSVGGSSCTPPRPGAKAELAPLFELAPRPGPVPRGGPLSARIHEPDRSGLPSARRGGGASMPTSPWAARGRGGSGTLPHCAAAETVKTPTKTRPVQSARVIGDSRVAKGPVHMVTRARGYPPGPAPDRRAIVCV